MPRSRSGVLCPLTLCRNMSHKSLQYLLVAFVLLTGASTTLAQVAAAPANAPKTGILIEPVQGQAQEAFSNRTGNILAFEYGETKFLLNPGQTKRVPVPKQAPSKFSIFEKGSDKEGWMPRFSAMMAPNPNKRFIPLGWAKPLIRFEFEYAMAPLTLNPQSTRGCRQAVGML